MWGGIQLCSLLAMNYSAFALQAKQEKTYRWSHTGGRNGWAGAGWLVGDWGVVGVEVRGDRWKVLASSWWRYFLGMVGSLSGYAGHIDPWEISWWPDQHTQPLGLPYSCPSAATRSANQ